MSYYCNVQLIILLSYHIIIILSYYCNVQLNSAIEIIKILLVVILIERFSIECRKQLRNCFGFALLRFVIG